jgi:energy-coupling factor transporter ATP-binding protein EcfA2
LDLPDALIVERFRSFAQRTVLPLRPLTLVYGANNSGKSALLRALALLAGSLKPTSRGAITLPERAFSSVQPRELAWQGVAGDYRWKLGLRWDGGGVRELVVTINPSAEGDTPIVALEAVRHDGGRWRARVGPDGVLVDPDTGSHLPFEGLLPAKGVAVLADLRARLSAAHGRIRWLASVRPPVPRLISGPAPSRDHVTDGSEVPHLLVEDRELREEVASFYATLDPPRALELHEAPPLGHYFSMNPTTRPSWRVHMGDTGEGMSQVLPVLAYAALTAREGGILAVEEPESHLHPSAQSQLAAYLCALAKRPTGPRFVVETHSRVMLLAVQRAVADGLPADHVQIAWVDQDQAGHSTLTPIALHASGRMGDGWPPSALAEDLRLARELIRASRASVEEP